MKISQLTACSFIQPILTIIMPIALPTMRNTGSLSLASKLSVLASLLSCNNHQIEKIFSKIARCKTYCIDDPTHPKHQVLDNPSLHHTARL